MNWGKKLVIGMSAFMSFIIVLGILMVRSANDPLVDEDYYEKGLNYEQEIQRMKKARTDSIRLSQEVTSHEQR